MTDTELWAERGAATVAINDPSTDEDKREWLKRRIASIDDQLLFNKEHREEHIR